MDPVWCLCGRRTGPARESLNVFHILRGPYGVLAGPARARKGIDTTKIWNNPAQASNLAVPGLFTISKPVRARKLIMHALKLYGLRMGRQNSYGAVRAPWVDVRLLFKIAREQSLGVWCDWGMKSTGKLNSLWPSDSHMASPSLVIHHWFRWWLVPWLVPSHYLNQCSQFVT